jgi:ATP-dependent 26S proteasome regulatory subunit
MAPGGSLTTSQLRIDERILNYLTGVRHIDERLACFVHQVAASENLPESHRSIVRQVISIWRDGQGKRRLPNVQLRGADVTSRSEIAAEVCREMGLGLFSLAANSIPSDPREQLILSRLCEREAILNGDVILVECDDADGSEKAREGSLVQFVERTACLLFVAGRERRMFPRRLTITLDVDPPSTNEQQIMWKERLGPIAAKMNGQIDRLVSQFSLNASMIRTVCDTVLCPPAQDSDDGKYDDTTAALWEACRIIARPQLQNLAQRIEPNIRWDDLVLAVEQKQVLREIALHVKNRLKVYETWGLAAKSPRGLGISALFTGASGTGKTMAAEVLANELKLDLFRIDLSQVVSKYIGETEKNLRSVFDAAESGGAILLFDEADALFGKRSEVKDSHDRYANIEVSYLLQRMENYRGLAILTTNMKEALDQAFLRRIRFVIQFPFPDAAQRAEIWKHVFPDSTPTDGLDAARLAKLSIPGGNIRNVATYAAFLAAESGTPVGMAQVLRAARVEYAKLERPLSDSEIAGWEPRH